MEIAKVGRVRMYCSDKCRVGQRRVKAARPKACLVCGAEMVVAPVGAVRMYCSKKCCKAARPPRRRVKDRSPIYPRLCELCDEAFIGRDAKARYCSQRCRQARKHTRIWIKDCEGCGAVVAFRRPNGKWCQSCKAASRLAYWTSEKERERTRRKNRQRRLSARRGAEIAGRYTLAEVVAKSSGSCHLCGDPVDMSLKCPDPQSPTIDHLVPLSKGGPDVLGNVMLAHRWCNTSRGAKYLEREINGQLWRITEFFPVDFDVRQAS